MLNFLNSRYRRIHARHNFPYSDPSFKGNVPVTLIVILCTSVDYIEEAKISALFAERFAV